MKKEKIYQIIKDSNVNGLNIFPYRYSFSVDNNRISCTKTKYFGIVVSEGFNSVDINFEPLRKFVLSRLQWQRYLNAIIRKETNLESYKKNIENIFNN